MPVSLIILFYFISSKSLRAGETAALCHTQIIKLNYLFMCLTTAKQDQLQISIENLQLRQRH